MTPFTLSFATNRNDNLGRSLHCHHQKFPRAGHAILLTSLLLVSGFGVLATSQLTTTYHFGMLASVTLATAFLTDILFLPALMHLNERWTGRPLIIHKLTGTVLY